MHGSMTPCSVHTLCFFSAHPPPDILVRRPSPGGTETTFPDQLCAEIRKWFPTKLSLGDGTVSGLINLVWSFQPSSHFNFLSCSPNLLWNPRRLQKDKKEISFIVIRFMTFPLMFDIWEGLVSFLNKVLPSRPRGYIKKGQRGTNSG